MLETLQAGKAIGSNVILNHLTFFDLLKYIFFYQRDLSRLVSDVITRQYFEQTSIKRTDV